MTARWLIETLRPVHFRGKRRLLSALTPRRGERSARIWGSQVRLDLADRIQRDIYLGCFEPGPTADARRALCPGRTFVDAGANVGYFTWLAARCVGRRGRVLAAEPSPVAFARLADSVRANGLTQVSVHPVGLSDAPGEAVLYVPPAANGNHSPTMAPAEGWDPIRVPVITLEALLDREGIDRVDLLKLDVEGHEPRVLAGLGPGLRGGRVRAVLCEFNDCWLRLSGSSPEALWETLTSAGFAPPRGRRPVPLSPGCVVTLFLSHRG